MFDLTFFKGQPTQYVLRYKQGRVVREGPALSFYFLRHNTTIVVVPISSADTSFIFNETTSNFQAITIQGTFTYRIAEPKKAAALLNFVFDPRRRAYESSDPERLPARITNVVQTATHAEIQRYSLEETLAQSEQIAARVLARIAGESLLESLGVELLSLYILLIKATPEVARALEAPYRETLLRNADNATYARRASAVEEERKIQESQLRSDITLEEQRRQLIESSGANAQQEAEFRGQALELEARYQARAAAMELGVYENLDPRLVLALGLKEIGENAGKVGTLMITSEVLAALLNAPPNAPASTREAGQRGKDDAEK